MIAIACPNCRTSLEFAEADAGKQVRCPACEQPVTVPRPAAPVGGRSSATTALPPAGASGEPVELPEALETVPPGSVSGAALSSAETATVSPSLAGTAAPTAPKGDSVPGYELLGELGRGGMGVVYRARQVGLNRLCALKMILAGEHAGEDDLARFRREAKAIARLQHSNIVAVYEVGQHDGKPFFSLEFCPGGSLDRRLAGTPIDPRAAARLVQTLALAMQAAHRANVIHRDLKPANVLLVDPPETPLERCTVKITDFGLAKKLDQSGQTQTGVAMGTPSYMAPEQAEGSKTVGPLADVYALGAILYECLVGRPPFKAATSFDTMLQVVGEEPVPPRQLNARVPVDLETICLKCLHKEAAKRYGSAQELADDLGRFLAGEPIVARRVGHLERAGKWVRRNPVVAALTAAVAVSLLLGAGVATALAVRAINAASRAESEAERANEETRKAESARAKAVEESDRADREAQDAKWLAKKEQKARQEAQDEAYRANLARHGFQMTAACQAWQQNDLRAAVNFLVNVPPLFQQTWEYRHLYSLFRRKTRIIQADWPVKSVCYSPNGKGIVSGGDGGLKVWDAHTGKHLVTLKAPPGARLGVSSVCYSPDGTRLVSGSLDGTLKVWDTLTGKHLLNFKGHASWVNSVAYSPDGRRLASGSEDDTVKLWDAATGRNLLTLNGHMHGVRSVLYSPDGKRIVSASQDMMLKVWDAGTGRDLLTLRGHTSGVTAVAFSPDSRRIVSGSRDKTLKVWDAVTGQHLLTLNGHTAEVTSVAYRPDGRHIVSGSEDRTVKVWYALTGQDLLSCDFHAGRVQSVCYSPDGRRIASGSSD